MDTVYRYNDYPTIYPNPDVIQRAVPPDLIAQPWAVWKAEPRQGTPGKYNKVPCHPATRRYLKTSEPATWASFDEALAAYQRGGWSGIGVLLTSNGIIGIDIDDAQEVIKARPEVQAWVNSMIEAGGYIERSPSGVGYRGFVRGVLPRGAKNRSDGMEIYDNARFLTITGAQLSEAI